MKVQKWWMDVGKMDDGSDPSEWLLHQALAAAPVMHDWRKPWSHVYPAGPLSRAQILGSYSTQISWPCKFSIFWHVACGLLSYLAYGYVWGMDIQGRSFYATIKETSPMFPHRYVAMFISFFPKTMISPCRAPLFAISPQLHVYSVFRDTWDGLLFSFFSSDTQDWSSSAKQFRHNFLIIAIRAIKIRS